MGSFGDGLFLWQRLKRLVLRSQLPLAQLSGLLLLLILLVMLLSVSNKI